MSGFFSPIAILAFLVGLTVHEWAHAFVATRLGDPTPHNNGRLTFNPVAHIDPLGAILFLTVGFGWAKPVPVNPAYFSEPKKGMFLTALAGPVSNFLLALFSFWVLLLLGVRPSVWSFLSLPASGSPAFLFFAQFFAYSLFTNLGMMAFNLLPIGPLDGSKALEAFIPLRYDDRYQEYLRVGPYILLALLLGERFLHIDVFGVWITSIMNVVVQGFSAIARILGH